MKQACALFAALVFAVTLGVAQKTKADASMGPVTLTGYVVDKMCAKGMAKKDNPMQKAAAHSKECALEEECAASGYGLFSDGKWYSFDDEGTKQARSMMQKEKREKGLAYAVTGTVEGNTIAVTSMKPTTLEAKATKKSEKPVSNQ